jgi:hypothetical protein
MTEKIKEIVDQFFKDTYNSWGTYQYKINSSYWVKFQPTMQKNYIRVYLYFELDGFEFSNSSVYEMQNGPLNDDDKGLAALVEMQYRNAERMNSSNVSIGYDLYKSVLADNDKLREEIKDLKKLSEDWHNKYIQEKMDHTTTQCRAIFAKHILNGDRDERVKEFLEKDINKIKLSQIFKNANDKTS